MPALAAAIPAITAISGLASAGTGVANAIAQGQNPGTQALPGDTGAMDPNAFQFGGGVQTDAQRQAGPALQQANANLQDIQQRIAKAQHIAGLTGMNQINAGVSNEQRDAAKAELAQLQAQLPQAQMAQQNAQKQFDAAPSLIEQDERRFQNLAATARGRETESFTQGMPSGADYLMQQGLDRANANAMGLAASARGGGGNAALAMRNAQMAQAQNAAQAAQNAGLLRSQEATQRGGLDLQARAQAAQEAQAYEQQRLAALGANQSGAQAFQTGESTRKTNLATGNRAAANEGFQNTQAAIQGAATSGGQALNATTDAINSLANGQPKPTTHAAYNGQTWKPRADGSGYDLT